MNNISLQTLASTLSLLILASGVCAQSAASLGGVVTSTAFLADVADFVEQHPDDFGGAFIDEETGVMTVQVVRAAKPWASALVDRLKTADARGRRQHAFAVVPVLVDHSLTELTSIEQSIAADSSWIESAGAQLYSWGKDHHSNSVTITVDRVTPALLEDAQRKFGDLVRILVGQPSVPTSREADVSPFWGGIRVTDLDDRCSAAFTISKLDNSARQLLTSGHCYNDGDTIVTSGDHNVIVGTVTGHHLDPSGLDSARIGGRTYDAVVFVGSATSNSSASVKGSWRPLTGETICADGAKSGERCGTTGLRDICVLRPSLGNLRTCHVTEIKVTSGFLDQGGDSGGPVIKRNPDGVYGVGIIIGGTNDTGGDGLYKTAHFHELPYVMPTDSYLLTK